MEMINPFMYDCGGKCDACRMIIEYHGSEKGTTIYCSSIVVQIVHSDSYQRHHSENIMSCQALQDMVSTFTTSSASRTGLQLCKEDII